MKDAGKSQYFFYENSIKLLLVVFILTPFSAGSHGACSGKGSGEFCLAARSQFTSFEKKTPLEVFFRQIELKYTDTDFKPSKEGYDRTEVLCAIRVGGGSLPVRKYELIFHDGAPLFLRVSGREVIPLYWLNIPYDSSGIVMEEKKRMILDSVGLICGYFGVGVEEWNGRVQYLYDFGPRFLSSENCENLGIRALVVFQGMLSPLEDLGQDERYMQRPDNTILEGVRVLRERMKPGERVLVYKPGCGAECISLALKGVRVTALCTSETEKAALECNAWLNGVDPAFLRITGEVSELGEDYDGVYSNLPRPVYPEESEVIPGKPGIRRLGFELLDGKFDRKGETTLRFLEVAARASLSGSVICVAPGIPSFYELVSGGGYRVVKAGQHAVRGDLYSMIL